MKETLDVLELDRVQMEDAFLKNEFIGRTTASYFVIIDKTVTDRRQVTEILEETGLLPEYQAVLFGENIGDGGAMDVSTVMSHPGMRIYALAVKKSLLEWTGSFHETLQAQGVLDDVFFRLIDHMAELDCSWEFSGEMGIMLDSFAEFERLARNTAPYLIFVGDDTCYSVPKRFAEELLALQG